MSQHRYQLFLDLDGVLADFNKGVKQTTGKYPHQLDSSKMWPKLRRAKGFFTHLSWTSDGQELWESTRHLHPPILTGLPYDGAWAAQQKREWCRRELGEEIPVVTCLARHKIDEAFAYVSQGITPVLIDDRTTHKDVWEDRGGIYIVHRSTQESLTQLSKIITLT